MSSTVFIKCTLSAGLGNFSQKHLLLEIIFNLFYGTCLWDSFCIEMPLVNKITYCLIFHKQFSMKGPLQQIFKILNKS